jgi:phosphatidate cytidylyltransferase
LLNKRTQTALILLVVFAASFMLGGWFLIALSIVVHFAINLELVRFTWIRSEKVSFVLAVLLLLIPVGYLAFHFEGLVYSSFALLIIFSAIILYQIENDLHQDDLRNRLLGVLLCVFYTGVIGSSFVVAAELLTKNALAFTILCVIATDTFGYFVGCRFGGTKLAVRISPNKTISGALAGLIGASLVAFAMFYFEYYGSSPFAVIVIGITVSTVSIVGDLFESLVKRSFNVKDSGNLLPGHGGALDRVDAMLFAFPLMLIIEGVF